MSLKWIVKTRNNSKWERHYPEGHKELSYWSCPYCSHIVFEPTNFCGCCGKELENPCEEVFHDFREDSGLEL